MTASRCGQGVADLILDVYRVVKRAQSRGILGTPDHLAPQQSRSRPATERLRAWLEAEQPTHLAHWLVARRPAARQAAAGPGSRHQRLRNVCTVMVLEPWSDMVSAPMGADFFDVCARIDPGIEARHRKVALRCVEAILGSRADAEVFLLALDGLLADRPTVAVLERRLRILAGRFAPARGASRGAARP